MIDAQKVPMFILTYQKTDLFPAPGAMILVKASVIEERVKELERSRKNSDVTKWGIIHTRFALQFDLGGKLFYTTELERTTPDYEPYIPLTVKSSSIRKHVWAQCSLEDVLIIPTDVKHEDRIIEFNTNDVTVFNHVVCDNEWHFSDEAPNNLTTFGIFDNSKQLWRIWNLNIAANEASNTAAFKRFILDYGMKSFSMIRPTPELFDNFEQFTKTITIPSTLNASNNDASQDIRNLVKFEFDIDSEDFANERFLASPLRPYATRITEAIFQILSNHRISTDVVRVDVSRAIRDITNESQVFIDFDDEMCDHEQ